MGNYQGYQKYQDSGVEWLGDIPEHWKVKRIKFLVSKIGSGKTPKGGSEVYIDSGIMLIRSQNVYDNGFRLDDVVYIDDEIDNIQANSRVFPNDILLNITGASIGRVCLVPTDFGKANVNQHVCIFRPKLKEIFPQYLHLLFCSTQGKEQIFSYENGTSREGLNFQEAGNLTFAIPPLNEQEKIAQFLDYKTKQIDDLIKKKETLIEKLDEKRTSLISHAVTKGLDSSVPMKDSGIEWLGEIPKHWEASKAKFASSIFVPQRNKPELNLDDGIPWLTMDDMLSDRIRKTLFKVSEEELQKAGSKVLRKNSVISSCVGNFAICAINDMDVIINQQLQAFIPFNTIFPEYLCELIRISKDYFKMIATAATVVYVNQSGFANMPILLPPKKEQEEIINFLTFKKLKIDQQKAKIKEAIELLKEYRTSLITNAVTGKIDVRQVAIP